MISFELEGHRFHLRAAAVVMQGGRVLLHRLEGDEVWALPGGRVNPGETAAAAVSREMLEEAAQAVHVGELLFVVENFFDTGRTVNHEVGLYFRVDLPPDSPLRDATRVHVGVEGAAKLEFRWFACNELHSVNVHPAFLREALARPDLSFRHVVQHG